MKSSGAHPKTNPEVDFYFDKAERWQKEIARLRMISLDSPLSEELKWGKPFYTFEESNILVIWAFKDHCALGFCKGALLKDASGVLSNIGENTQGPRKVKFTSLEDVVKLESVLKEYIQEAIDVEKAGLQVKYKETSEFKMPAELKEKLEQSPAFKAAFEGLTPGRQRGYLLHFSAPKQSTTRTSRVEKCRAQILIGKGLHDR